MPLTRRLSGRGRNDGSSASTTPTPEDPHQVVPFSWRKGGPYQVAQPPKTGPYQVAHDISRVSVETLL